MSRRLDLKFGYGLPAFGGRFTWTPEVGASLSDTGRDYSLGWRLVRGPGSGEAAAVRLRFLLRRAGARARMMTRPVDGLRWRGSEGDPPPPALCADSPPPRGGSIDVPSGFFTPEGLHPRRLSGQSQQKQQPVAHHRHRATLGAPVPQSPVHRIPGSANRWRRHIQRTAHRLAATPNAAFALADHCRAPTAPNPPERSRTCQNLLPIRQMSQQHAYRNFSNAFDTSQQSRSLGHRLPSATSGAPCLRLISRLAMRGREREVLNDDPPVPAPHETRVTGGRTGASRHPVRAHGQKRARRLSPRYPPPATHPAKIARIRHWPPIPPAQRPPRDTSPDAQCPARYSPLNQTPIVQAVLAHINASDFFHRMFHFLSPVR